jgi:serine/threonine protein kinase
VTSSRKPNIVTKTSRLAISVSDFLGIKKSDSIENFYEIEKIIGRGAFGEVAKATHIYTGETRAIKIIDKRKL